MKWFDSIRSIATFLLVVTLCASFLISNKISPESFLLLVSGVIAYYFNKDRSNPIPPENKTTSQTTITSEPPTEEKPLIKVQHMDL